MRRARFRPCLLAWALPARFCFGADGRFGGRVVSVNSASGLTPHKAMADLALDYRPGRSEELLQRCVSRKNLDGDEALPTMKLISSLRWQVVLLVAFSSLGYSETKVDWR